MIMQETWDIGIYGYPGRQGPLAAQVETLVQRFVGDTSRRNQRQICQKPYPEWIDRANPFLRTFKISDFTLFSRMIEFMLKNI